MPLGVIFSFVNNFLELRGDILKIIMQLRRPIPQRVEAPNQWNSAMLVISFFAAIVNATLVGMFPSVQKDGTVPADLNFDGAILAVLIGILCWLAANLVVSGTIAAIPLQRQKDVDKLDLATRELLLRLLDVPEGRPPGIHVDEAKEQAVMQFIVSIYKMD
jgi:hypothetical protein